MNSVELLRKAGIECTFNREIRKIVRYAQEADEHSIYVDVSKKADSAYLRMAVDAGAIVLSEKEAEGCIRVDKAARVFTELLQIFYDFPYRKIKLIGVTGTCGKSTVIHLLRDCLKNQGIESCAVMTGKVFLGDEVMMSRNTTPDASFLIPLMKKCLDRGIQVLMMEVSSEAFINHRVDGLYYDVMIGTIIASDHLDSHHTVEQYWNVKKKILSLVKPDGNLILNADDPLQMKWRKTLDAHVLTYGFSNANFQISECQESLTLTTFVMQNQIFVTHLLSKANILNLASVIACAFALDLRLSRVFQWIHQVKGCRGRFDVIYHSPYVMIDYAHTEQAVRTVLEFVRNCTDQRIICVFGCGGDRDKTKRPLIGKTVCEFADAVIVTSDNPRNEDPLKIIEEIVKGCTKEVIVEVDRVKAIQFALETCSKNDIIVLLGKGDETSLYSGGKMISASDFEIVSRFL